MSFYRQSTPLFQNWMKRHFNRSQMRDMANHGANIGFHGLNYFHETTKLYNKYFEDIWEMLNEDAESIGHKHPLEMIATFNGAANATDRARFEYLLVIYAAERVAFKLTE